MVVCPNCSTENRSGAKFCKNCAARLPVSSAVTRPLDLEEFQASVATDEPDALPLTAPGATVEPGAASPPAAAVTRRINADPRSGTRRLPPPAAFLRRPDGALFGDQFLLDEIVSSRDHRHTYRVHQIDVPQEQHIQVCPNSDCGAVFMPLNGASEKFCTDCGNVLEAGGKDLELIESQAALSEHIVRLAAKGLSHGSVRAPLAAFIEKVAGEPRHCLVRPRTQEPESTADGLQALRAGIALARGLDYLHDNGVTFNGKVDTNALAVAGGRIVWANFDRSELLPEGRVSERRHDAEALARLIFFQMTGKARYEQDASLAQPAAHAFETIFSGAGIESATELADLFENALEEMAAVRTFDYLMGRRTHVGMVRTLNEDSLMSLEINRILRSSSAPLGVYVVADGMGGHTAGEVASGAIINSISQLALKDLLPSQLAGPGVQDRSDWLRRAVAAANSEVFHLRQAGGNDMGSTLVAAVLDGNRAYITHVGDSRAYRINSQGIRRLTVDHSLVERLIASKQITREEARSHPQRNVIYRTVGDKAEVEIDIHALMLDVGDYLLLCSDGLSGMVDDATMQEIVLGTASPQDACDMLVRAANDAGGDDNISVVIVKIVEA